MALRIEVDEGRCRAIGNCAAYAPAVFDQNDEDGRVVLLDAAPPVGEHGRVRDAELRCPTASITLHETVSADDA
ncbi:4Fe-4S domain-containing protein [Streptomyces sp. DW26H14]|uniref:4Fe-4S domain-containing protein n=1 Tax=Streptomyces sp. DW26H14 TaxID=3435395 RepID=UPI00403DA5F5